MFIEIWVISGLLGFLYFIRTSGVYPMFYKLDSISDWGLGDYGFSLIILCGGMVTLGWAIVHIIINTFHKINS